MSAEEFVISASAALPGTVNASQKVYKDDCMYSFDTAENNALGLDVCMTCFQAFARAPQKNYTAEHYAEKRHPLYVNITKTLKPESERRVLEADTDDSKLKKAKLEIKEQKESDIYDIVNSVYIVPLDTSLCIEDTPEPAKLLALQILRANSASTNDEIKAWEQQIFPCEHSVDIQTQEPANTDLAQCAYCDLKENLWVCLTCGTVGCGREQYGSSLKGNSHALEHFNSTGHAVAVKLGSLSADDEESCDCYCYLCNDEVKVPELSNKLLKFGLDLKNSVKTEKNLIELNLDTNKNWQFDLDGANGDKLRPIFGSGLTGFQNLGNSCYLNSVIQALFSLPQYREFFKSRSFDKSVRDPALDLTSQMIKIYDGLLSGRYSKPNELKGDDYQLGIKPSTFKTLVGSDHAEFSSNKQQDACEFLLYLLDKLDKEFGLSLNKDFKFLVSNKVICSSCRSGSTSEDLVDNISVPITETLIGEDEDGKKIYKEVKLEESFQKFHSVEEIENFKCDSCGQTTTSLKSSGFFTYPKNLIVSVQRIKLENWVPVKIDVPITVPEEIDLSAYGAPEFEEGETKIDHTSSTQPAEFVPNSEALSMLLSMGFSEPRCLRGLYNTGNKDAEEAMNWVFAHMDDADIDTPFNPAEESSATDSGSSNEPSAESIENLVAMGFSQQLAKKALVVNSNDVNASVEWLFNNPDDDGVIENTKSVINVQKEADDLKKQLLQSTPSSTNYKLKAVVCHKGSSPHTGHYVVFIRIEGKWVLFNDEKVVECDESNLEDMRNNGYIYFFNSE
ncbi:CIC11C00000001129 [Sungouiella intermedia]|uniref:Ubiquitin carboxyl-terminal hydrolase n=1 Tax=Sungouiella intermedia TaxID=45354 RepID=A0A1L0DL71_9ASCO|nr:CIC11C00000001129 [[Candida] intermedia]